MSKTIRQAERVLQVSSTSSLYNDTEKSEKFFKRRKCENNKRAHAFKGYASFYNIEILNSFNLELQIKDNESANKNKLKKLLTKIRGFKFVTTSVSVLMKIESEDKT